MLKSTQYYFLSFSLNFCDEVGKLRFYDRTVWFYFVCETIDGSDNQCQIKRGKNGNLRNWPLSRRQYYKEHFNFAE